MTVADRISVGDRVLLRWKQGKTSKRKLTKPLREDGDTGVDNHTIKHKDIIGQESDVRLVSVSKDRLRKLSVFAQHPSLDDFTSLSPRRVAPIYATYASTIVSLLDIHVEPPSAENDPDMVNGPCFQILEAGTGHGSLTLQLSRAISAANPPASAGVRPKPSKTRIFKAGEESDGEIDEPESDALVAWRKQRRAVVHTVDIDPLNRAHADKLIRSYRSAIYWPHINFYAGNVHDWIIERIDPTGQKPFLDVVVLDMPDVEKYISSVVGAVKDGGQLLVFVPQITQIAACVQEIVTKDLGLKLEKVVELGDGISNGRLWDVRMAALKNNRIFKHAANEPHASHDGDSENASNAEISAEPPAPSVGTIPPMVCRPLVGELTRGGGFIGLWKRISNSAAEQPSGS